MLTKVSRGSPISRSALHERLRAWVVGASDLGVIGDTEPPNQKRTPWIWINEDLRLYRLHADTTGAGVRRYLALVTEHGEGLLWTIVDSQRGNPTKVAFGPSLERIPGFFLYFQVEPAHA